ncbi:hypothetical protein [Methylobacterium sp. Leaf93]|uniref:head-tail joining protein n=1 Tax=Methylobacterium sp. Leaf93 TaxID=1736249 RepID=UPI0006F2EE58|nr:hypothetical protein [Methylobacterium sp. Leaf93]KQP02657.1 hypothetical protein ASF26_14605 [Methylobacterium sp. Leaf93]
MDAFAMGVDAIFDDPNLAIDAIWRAGGGSDGVSVRVIRKTPEAVVGLAGNQFDLDAMLIDIRLSEVAVPAKGDAVDLLDDDGELTETLLVIGMGKIDTRRLVRTCEVSAVQPDDPDEDPDEP